MYNKSIKERDYKMASFSIIAAVIQLLTIAFWIFIVYVAVVLLRNSNHNKKSLENIELELRKIHDRLINNSNHD
jgi:large-conductance mechanosensitive channel